MASTGAGEQSGMQELTPEQLQAISGNAPDAFLPDTTDSLAKVADMGSESAEEASKEATKDNYTGGYGMAPVEHDSEPGQLGGGSKEKTD